MKMVLRQSCFGTEEQKSFFFAFSPSGSWAWILDCRCAICTAVQICVPSDQICRLVFLYCGRSYVIHRAALSLGCQLVAVLDRQYSAMEPRAMHERTTLCACKA
eukprot:627260-Rhodomonas_salina.1